VILEATGGLETPVASALATGGIAAAIIDGVRDQDDRQSIARLGI
jgi:hypothetical protein